MVKLISVIFETDDYPALKKIIEASGGSVTIEYKSVNMLAASIPPGSLKTIQKSPHCLCAYPDTKKSVL